MSLYHAGDDSRISIDPDGDEWENGRRAGIDECMPLLIIAYRALMSYRFGNASTDLAREVTDRIYQEFGDLTK